MRGGGRCAEGEDYDSQRALRAVEGAPPPAGVAARAVLPSGAAGSARAEGPGGSWGVPGVLWLRSSGDVV